MTAGVNAQEQAGIDSINGLQGKTDAYLGQASGLAQGATAAVTPGALNLQQFENPYQSDVINATMAQIGNMNAQQRQGQTSAAISAGAFGGDRAGVAQAALANQQDLASNATLAGLNQANYTQALAAAQQQQGVKLSADQSNRDALAAGSQLYAGLGSLANSTGLANAGAQLQGGILQQQTQQAADTAKYTQFQNQQAYPFQTAQFLAGITGSLAPELGGTSSGTQQQSAPNVLNSIIGGGLGLGTFFLPKADGGRVVDLDVERRARGGRTLGGDMDYAGLGAARRYASGGIASMPYADAGGYVPAVGLAQGRAPQFGSTGMQAPQQPDTSMSNLSAGLGMATRNFLNNSNAGDAVSDFAQDRLGFADGGKVISLGLARAARGYDDGGVVSPDPLALTFDANALGEPSLLGGLQPGLGVAKAPDPSSMTPPAPIARPAAPALAPPQMGLDAAAASPRATPGLAAAEKVPPMAPAPNVTPVVGYRGADGTVTPASGLAAADASKAPASGLAAINKAAPVSPDSMDSYYGRVRAIESSGGDNSATSPAGATGAYQIMPATWADLSKKHPDLGLTPDGMRDPTQQNAAVRALTADNTAQLKSALGRDPTPAELYLAHQQGAAGAISMLTNPNARAGDLVGDKAIAMNGGDPNMKAGDFAGMWSSKFNGATPVGAMAFAGTPSAGTPSAASPQPGLGSAAAPASGLAAAASTGQGLLDSIIPGGIHVSDDARTALLAASLGMMASPSRSVGQALGQGGLEGVKTYQNLQKLGVEKGLAAANIANLQSETAYRSGQLSIEGRKQDLAERQAQRMLDALDAIGTAFKTPPESGGTQSGASASQSSLVGTPLPTSTSNAPPAAAASPSSAASAGAFDWSKVAPQSNPAILDGMADKYERASIAAAQSPEIAAAYNKMALQYRSSAAQIRQSGKLTLRDGQTVVAPGFADSEAAIEGAKTDARARTEAGYRLRESEPKPGEPTVFTTDAAIIGQQGHGVGAGSPPGSTAGEPPAVVAKQPAFYAAKQDMIAKNETEMVQQYQARQIAKQRLQDLQDILLRYKTGAFAEQKADIAAKLSAAGIPVSKDALANAANFQKFTKDATANLFDQVKGMGGRVLVSEIEGLKNANANAELQPSANAAIVGQGIGLLNYEDRHTNDYFAWKKQNPNATDTSSFELPWSKANPVGPFVKDARLATAAKGVDIPPAAQRVEGQAYVTPKGRAVWTRGGWKLSP